jgi:hypothetical protein
MIRMDLEVEQVAQYKSPHSTSEETPTSLHMVELEVLTVEVVAQEVDLLSIISKVILLIVNQSRAFTGLEPMILLEEMLVRCLISSKLQTTANQVQCSIQSASQATVEFSAQLAQLAFISMTTHLESVLSAKINQEILTM